MAINLKHLSYLVSAAEHRSITDASVSLGVSQPAISAAVKSLEDEFGYLIFVRNPAQGLSVTSAGKLFIQQAQRLLEGTRDFDQQVRGIGNQLSGEVQVGCYFITAPYLLPPVIRQFRDKHTHAEVRLHETDLAQVVSDLKSSVTDIAITYDMYLDSAIVHERLFQVTPHVLLSREDPLANEKEISLYDLATKAMVLLDLAVTQDYFLNYFYMHQIQPNVQYRLKSFEMIRSLVGAGLGFSFGFLPLSITQSYQGEQLVRRSIKEEVPEPWVCMAYSRQMRPTRILDEFMKETRDVLVKLQ